MDKINPALPLVATAPVSTAPVSHPNETGDELVQLTRLLQQLEQSDQLSLDELDAVIARVDALYQRRLERLEHTRRMVAQLGTRHPAP